MILRFEGSFGYVTPDGYATSYNTAFLERNGTIRSITSADIPDTSISGLPNASKYSSTIHSTSQNVEEAKRLIDETNKSGFPFNARVDITAGAGIVPGGIVNIDEYNANFDGMWYVRSVEHSVGGTEYLTHLNIARDFTVTKEFKLPAVEKMATPPAAVFSNGTWTAAIQKVNRYV
jgi:hypothetical protein